MRGLLQSQRAYALGVILGAVIILSPISSLAIVNNCNSVYEVELGNSINYSPADSTTYYLGHGWAQAPDTNEGQRAHYVNATGTIIAVSALITVGGTKTNELTSTSSLVINDNDASSTFLFNIPYSSTINVTSTNLLSIPISPGQHFEISQAHPVLVTNPVTVRDYYTITIQNSIPGGCSNSSSSSSTLLMSSTTDAIVGNVFDMLYLLMIFFFFISVFWITFKITKR